MKIILTVLLTFSSCFGFDFSQIKQLIPPKASGKFTQSKQISGFSAPIKTGGEFVLEPDFMLWEVKTPIQSSSKISKDGIFVLNDAKWQKSSANVDSELMLALFSLDENRLKKSFDMHILGDESSWSIMLKPKNLILKEIFDVIKITGAKHVDEIYIKEMQGDETLTKFYDLK